MTKSIKEILTSFDNITNNKPIVVNSKPGTPTKARKVLSEAFVPTPTTFAGATTQSDPNDFSTLLAKLDNIENIVTSMADNKGVKDSEMIQGDQPESTADLGANLPAVQGDSAIADEGVEDGEQETPAPGDNNSAFFPNYDAVGETEIEGSDSTEVPDGFDDAMLDALRTAFGNDKTIVVIAPEKDGGVNDDTDDSLDSDDTEGFDVEGSDNSETDENPEGENDSDDVPDESVNGMDKEWYQTVDTDGNDSPDESETDETDEEAPDEDDADNDSEKEDETDDEDKKVEESVRYGMFREIVGYPPPRLATRAMSESKNNTRKSINESVDGKDRNRAINMSNTPDEIYYDELTQLTTLSGGPNNVKVQYRKQGLGDNAITVGSHNFYQGDNKKIAVENKIPYAEQKLNHMYSIFESIIKEEDECKCKSCKGTGKVKGSNLKCTACKGTGKKPEKKETVKESKTKCKTCDGTGKVKRMKCNECSGSGYMIESSKLKKKSKISETVDSSAYDEGYRACIKFSEYSEDSSSENPYDAGTQEYKDWNCGCKDANKSTNESTVEQKKKSAGIDSDINVLKKYGCKTGQQCSLARKYLNDGCSHEEAAKKALKKYPNSTNESKLYEAKIKSTVYGATDKEHPVIVDYDYEKAYPATLEDPGNEAGIVINSVKLAKSGADITKKLTPRQLDDLEQEIMQELADSHYDRADYEYEKDRDDRMMKTGKYDTRFDENLTSQETGEEEYKRQKKVNYDADPKITEVNKKVTPKPHVSVKFKTPSQYNRSTIAPGVKRKGVY